MRYVLVSENDLSDLRVVGIGCALFDRQGGMEMENIAKQDWRFAWSDARQIIKMSSDDRITFLETLHADARALVVLALCRLINR